MNKPKNHKECLSLYQKWIQDRDEVLFQLSDVIDTNIGDTLEIVLREDVKFLLSQALSDYANALSQKIKAVNDRIAEVSE